MEYKEYGSKNNDIIILLHGGGLSWWNYIDEISLLENEFHIVIPILDGHSGSDTNFTSIESNALEIINFINKKEKEKSAELRLKLETENAKREINKALSAEQLHIKRKLSKKQQELREKIFIDLQAKLEIFRKSSDYPKWLEEKIKEAQNIADSDEIQIYLSKIDENLKESIEAETGISIQLSEEPFMGGMRAVIPAKNILIDQTFLTMFESEKEEFNFDGGLLNE